MCMDTSERVNTWECVFMSVICTLSLHQQLSILGWSKAQWMKQLVDRPGGRGTACSQLGRREPPEVFSMRHTLCRLYTHTHTVLETETTVVKRATATSGPDTLRSEFSRWPSCCHHPMMRRTNWME